MFFAMRTHTHTQWRARRARMQLPSLVITMPPMGSRIIFSMAHGPSVLRMISLTAFADVMLLSCALWPWLRDTFWPNTCNMVPAGHAGHWLLDLSGKP